MPHRAQQHDQDLQHPEGLCAENDDKQDIGSCDDDAPPDGDVE